jgi:hypothetical protein
MARDTERPAPRGRAFGCTRHVVPRGWHLHDITRLVLRASGDEEVMGMSSKGVTGKKAASAAAKTLNSASASKAAKTAAASALSQTPRRRTK